MHIIVLGGAGAIGRVTARTLTEYEDIDQVTIADYNMECAHEVAATLNSSKIQVKQIDVNDADRLASLVRGADVVLGAVEYVFNQPILKACIQEKVHYADLGGLFHMKSKLMDMGPQHGSDSLNAHIGMGGTPSVN